MSVARGHIVWVLALALPTVQCGTDTGAGSLSFASDGGRVEADANTGVPEARSNAPDRNDTRPDATTPAPMHCALPDDPPYCPSEATDRHVCDGTIPFCSMSDGGDTDLFACRNLNDGFALEWARLVPVPGTCDDRPLAACPPSDATDAARAQDAFSSMLDSCLGNENFVDVWLTAGCVTHFVSSARNAEKAACLSGKLGASRLDCTRNLRCSGALLSTLK